MSTLQRMRFLFKKRWIGCLPKINIYALLCIITTVVWWIFLPFLYESVFFSSSLHDVVLGTGSFASNVSCFNSISFHFPFLSSRSHYAFIFIRLLLCIDVWKESKFNFSLFFLGATEILNIHKKWYSVIMGFYMAIIN